MEHTNINSVLTVEMLERIFRLLPSRDLKMVVLVSWKWREVEEAPGLKVLDLGGTFCKLLTTVEPRRLARALTKMEEVNLTYAGLTWCHQAGGRCKLSSLPSVNAPTS